MSTLKEWVVIILIVGGLIALVFGLGGHAKECGIDIIKILIDSPLSLKVASAGLFSFAIGMSILDI